VTATMLKHPSGLSCPPRFGTLRNPDRPTLGPHVGRVAESLGKRLMPWQQYVADVAMEVDPDGNLHYRRVVVTVPRQSGKTTLILPVFVHRSIAEFPGGKLEDGPQRQTVVYTAQTRNDARKKWMKEFIPLVEASPFDPQMDKRLTNGSEGFDWLNGSTFDLMATMEKSGHGDTVDLGIIDEAFAQQDDRLEQAVEPAMLTRRSPQFWIISTAGENEFKSPYLWSEVRAGRELCELGVDSDTAYFEWSLAPDDDPDDIDVIAERHPAVGFTVSVGDLQRLRDRAERKGDMAGFRRAYCNMWGTVGISKEPKLPAEAWAATAGVEVQPQPGLSLSFAVAPDGEWSSIALSMGSLADPYVAVIEHRQGVGWLPGRLVELVGRWSPLAVGFNNAGPAAAQAAAVLAAFRDADISADLLVPVNTSDYKSACGGFYTDVVEGRLRRPDGQGPLDVAVADAAERPLGDAWAWDMRNATVPISPLEAVTVARYLLPTENTTIDAAANVW
jgi:hypothetical protein